MLMAPFCYLVVRSAFFAFCLARFVERLPWQPSSGHKRHKRHKRHIALLDLNLDVPFVPFVPVVPFVPIFGPHVLRLGSLENLAGGKERKES